MCELRCGMIHNSFRYHFNRLLCALAIELDPPAAHHSVFEGDTFHMLRQLCRQMKIAVACVSEPSREVGGKVVAVCRTACDAQFRSLPRMVKRLGHYRIPSRE